ncbi:MAG: ankyrin repeat domain-containing protein [Candidatus Eisenbacteria bacterium]
MSKPRALFVFMLALAALATPAGAGQIHEAIVAGDLSRVTELIQTDPAVVHERNTNQTQDYPLHTAAMHGQVEIARMLLAAGAELEAGDRDNSTPLHDACLNRQTDMVAFLIESGADVNRHDYNGAYALSFAAAGGDTAVVRMVLGAGAALWYRERSGLSLLHFAASRGLEDLADTLLAMGEDTNARTASGETPLMWAVARNQYGMAHKLLSHGAQPRLGNEHGETPLHRAAQSNRLDLGRLLLAWGAPADAGTGQGWNPTPLIYACGGGHSEFAQLLISHGADVNHRADGRLPLTMAIERGHTDLVAVLLENGADIEVTEPNLGCSPLHIAALRGYRDIAQMLLDHGAPVAAVNTRGETPLELAGRYGHRDIVELLVERGAHGRTTESDRSVSAFAALPEKEAGIWFLEHSGWGIKTKNHFLVFDYFEQRRPPAEPGLCNGYISPAELAGENVIVFVSHVHGDHYDPRIWGWREQIPKLTYVLGFQPAEEVPPYELMVPRQARTIDGVKITTIESNDSGVGFWVETDGLTILHPGDHANRQRDFSGPYREEIDWLAQKGVRPDLAFFPISGCGFGDPEAVKLGVHYALETLKPRVFFPMHAGDMTNRYQEFINECRDRFPGTRMEAAVVRGDLFHYGNGRLEALASRE